LTGLSNGKENYSNVSRADATLLTLGTRDCIAGIMKSMTLSYIPDREYKDDPPVTLALFNPSPKITLLDYNFSRIPIKDVKGFEVIIVLFASLFVDILKSTQHDGQGLLATDIKRETQRLQKLEEKEEERSRRQEAEEIDRETERLRKLAQEEYLEKKRQDAKVEKETERLRWQEGWYNADHKPPPYRPPSQQGKKKHWWAIGGGAPKDHWGQDGVNTYQGQAHA
jgi:hypothetical protein